MRLITSNKQSELVRHSDNLAQIHARVRTLTEELSTLQRQLDTNNSSFRMLLRFLLLIPEMCHSSEILREFKELSETTYRAKIADEVGHIRPIGETVAAATTVRESVPQSTRTLQTVATATAGRRRVSQRARTLQTLDPVTAGGESVSQSTRTLQPVADATADRESVSQSTRTLHPVADATADRESVPQRSGTLRAVATATATGITNALQRAMRFGIFSTSTGSVTTPESEIRPPKPY